MSPRSMVSRPLTLRSRASRATLRSGRSPCPGASSSSIACASRPSIRRFCWPSPRAPTRPIDCGPSRFADERASTTMWRAASADPNLLCGIIALQMDFISRDALIAGMNAWVLDKAKPLDAVLLEQKRLTPEAHAVLEPVVRLHLANHDDDPE